MRALVLATILVTAPAYAAPDVRVYAEDGNTTIGETVVDGEPSEIYAVVLDYARWTEVFPDIAKVIVTAHQGAFAKVTLVKPDGNRDNLVFKNQPQARMVYFEDTGNSHAVVWGEIVFAPGAQPGTTRVRTRLHADVHGLASLVVSSTEVRHMREQKLARDLAHIRSYFHRARTASR